MSLAPEVRPSSTGQVARVLGVGARNTWHIRASELWEESVLGVAMRASDVLLFFLLFFGAPWNFVGVPWSEEPLARESSGMDGHHPFAIQSSVLGVPVLGTKA